MIKKNLYLQRFLQIFFFIMKNVQEVYLDVPKYEIQRVGINPTRINAIYLKKKVKQTRSDIVYYIFYDYSSIDTKNLRYNHG